jgi:hypothetical protein
MLWRIEEIEGCEILPQYCYMIVIYDAETDEDMHIKAGELPVGFTHEQAVIMRDILNQQITDTEAALGLDSFNIKPIKEIN